MTATQRLARALVCYAGSLLVAVALVGGCDGAGDDASGAAHPVLKVADDAIEDGKGIQAKRVDDLAQRQLAFNAGWESSYARAWLSAMHDAREDGPSEFRARVFGAWPRVILLALLLGVLIRVLLSVRLPHWSTLARDGEEKVGRVRQAGMLGLKFLAWLRAPLTVLAGPPAEAQDDLMRSVQAARDAERHLKAAGEAAVEAAAGADAGARLSERIGDWRSDVAQLRKHLEEEGAGASRKRARGYLDALTETRRAAEQLRVDLTRAGALEAGVAESTWNGFQRDLDRRPAIPTLKKSEGKAVPPWVRLLGWAGLGALGAAVFAIAAWAAAGALPFFIALLVAAGGVLLTASARALLGSRSDVSLLPGLADRLIGRLIAWVAIAMTLMVLSSMASQESGLDLGDPPLVEVPRAASEVHVPAPPMGLLPQPEAR